MSLMMRSGLSGPSLVSLRFVEQVVCMLRSDDRKENAHAHRTADSSIDDHRRGTRDIGALGPTTDDGASARATRACHFALCRRQDKYAGGARTAADEADGRQMADTVLGPARGWIAR